MGTNATLFRSPVQPLLDLCVVEQGSEHVRIEHRGQVYIE